MENNSFFALISRMKYINRWGLMHNTRYETLCEHSLEVATVAHALAVIGNQRLGKNYNESEIALVAMYHDTPEIITGDLPTPIKYKNSEIKKAYKQIENDAAESLVSKLPEDLQPNYEKILNCKDDKILLLVKAADKISALIKCIEERKIGNHEFDSAYNSTLEHLNDLNCEEADIFLKEFIPAYELTLDDQSKFK